ncbi:hypothetical protein [Tritonibacter mobilis]|jgi:uncharacterized BrkB/YihY/UPF0761 family membrane protein|uniref:hypothetical protein n=1 Tax=Tritonibacter mobilis TaxID=379347 RepID=UPI000806D4E6|nr:hypothetical protein [Tritonibacter mobilis]MCZ4270151.1 hypothetical protein [Rhodobacteraceae bacterium G21628-S1]NKX29371.1 hypothetical protein [Rhodobacteraceae bacterium R_SAG6]NKX38104.1 hypothetical protein [Rhodobacteraceae bacterium R_SAG5]MBU3034476.1 hypothetical protein [Tritonibacter mobilis]WHQ81506.1 hypothetical protein OMR53_09875 [Tritonibacter mobilis]
MSEADTPMTTQREVRQRKRGLYWLIALVALILLGLAIFGLGDDLTSVEGQAIDAPTAESVTTTGESGD